MIVANLATYPPRRESMLSTAQAILPQVDRLNIVLNEYDAIPSELRDDRINAIVPDEDLKDTGKFYPEVEGASYIFCIDDDVLFPNDFVSRTLHLLSRIDEKRIIASYHASLYLKPKFRMRYQNLTDLLSYQQRLADFRKVYTFYKAYDAPVIVDQVATNVCVMPRESYPSWEFMKGSQKFVDVRLALWAFENGITPVSLPREADWLQPIRYEETIFDDFTRNNPKHVNDEISRYAFKVPRRGTELTLRASSTED